MTLALPYLFDAVVARFALDAAALDPPVAPVPQAFGWREPAKRTGALRIVWVPGDDESGDMGEVAAARNPGGNPRPLATLNELFTVYLEAVDLDAPENERAQYIAARELYDAWLRAVYLAVHGAFAIQGQTWVTEKSVRRYGATIRVLCTVEAMVPDATNELAATDASALVTTHLEPNDTEGETDSVSAV